MFDYKQDIGLLHGSLLSAANNNSGNLINCHDVSDAAKIVLDTIRKIIQKAVNDIEDPRKKLETRLHYNERLHAAVFFTLLRSNSIKSDSADEFYNSILYNWPSFDFKFYIELNYICDWSEYFIKSALQLPDEVLLKVLKIIQDISSPSDTYNFSRHLIFQILIFKLFNASHGEVKYPFNFSFVYEVDFSSGDKSDKLIKKDDDKVLMCKSNWGNDKTIKNEDVSIKKFEDIEIMKSSSTKVEECSRVTAKEVEPNKTTVKENNLSTDITPYYEEMLCNLLNCISSKLEETDDIEVLKILLHALKTMLKVGLVGKSIDKLSKLQLFRISSILSLLNKFLQSEAGQDQLKYEIESGPKLFVSHVSATCSWSMSLNYLLLLLSHYIDEWTVELKEDSPLNTKNDLKTLISILIDLYSPFMKKDENLKLLTKVVQLKLQGSSYIARIFITDPTLKERKDVLKIAEENCHVINFEHSYSSVIDSIKSAESAESKLKLLQIFYKCLCGVNINIYDTVLNYILCKHGFTDEFQLPDFNDQLFEFSRVSPTLEKVEKDLSILFIQNPMAVLRYLIDQVLVQGSEGKVFIQLLPHFPKTCLFKNPDGLCALHIVLDEYFQKKKLQAYEIKNMVILYKFLTEVHSESSILSPCSFFRKCIIPKLQCDHDKIELILECAYILMPVLLTDNSLEDSEFVQLFVISFGLLVNNCIVTGNGKLKSLVVPILKEFETYQKKTCGMSDEMKLNVWSSLHLANEMTCAYIQNFLPEDIEFTSKKYVWTWCCKNEDSSQFEEKFSVETLTYISLLNALNEVLPHLTKEEWLFSLKLLKICCKNTNLRQEMTLFNKSLQLCESKSNTYSIVLALINSLHFIINDDVERSSYINSCFSNGLINLLSQEKSIQNDVLLFIILEVFYLVSCIPADLIQTYVSVLLELLKKVSTSSSVQSYQEIYRKIIFDAIDCLPNSSAKNYLSNKCNI